MLDFFKNFLPKITAALAAAVLLAGCFQETGLSTNPVDPAPGGEIATMRIRMRVGAVNALGKGQTISLSKMIVVMTSSGSPSDTVRDTIKAGLNQGFVSNPATIQVIDSMYTLKALRSWKVKVTVRDSKDSLIHADSATTPVLYIKDTAIVNLGLSSRYGMYDAQFQTIPDSITSTTGNLKQVLRINRLVLKIDGVIVKDSTSSPKPYFDSLKTHTISYDYVRMGTGHTVELSMYGPMGSWNTANPLYTGTKTINANPGIDSTVTLALAWVGPSTGGGSITATLGKVGKVSITGKLPGTL